MIPETKKKTVKTLSVKQKEKKMMVWLNNEMNRVDRPLAKVGTVAVFEIALGAVYSMLEVHGWIDTNKFLVAMSVSLNDCQTKIAEALQVVYTHVLKEYQRIEGL